MKRMILNGLALTVIALGGARLHAKMIRLFVRFGFSRCCGQGH